MKDRSGKHNAYADGLSRLNENKKIGSRAMFQDALKVVKVSKGVQRSGIDTIKYQT